MTGPSDYPEAVAFPTLFSLALNSVSQPHKTGLVIAGPDSSGFVYALASKLGKPGIFSASLIQNSSDGVRDYYLRLRSILNSTDSRVVVFENFFPPDSPSDQAIILDTLRETRKFLLVSNSVPAFQWLGDTIQLPDFPEDPSKVVETLLPPELVAPWFDILPFLVDRPLSDLTGIIRDACLFSIAHDLQIDEEIVKHILLQRGLSFNGSSKHTEFFYGSERQVELLNRVLNDSRERNVRSSTVFVISGPAGCGKSLLAHQLASSSCRPPLILLPSEILDPVVGLAEKKLHSIFSSAKGAAIIIENGEELFPCVSDTGSVQRLLPTVLSCLDRYPTVAFLTTRSMALIHPRLLRRCNASAQLDAELSETPRTEMVRARLRATDAVVEAAIGASAGFNGAAVDRMLRDAGVRAIARHRGGVCFKVEDFCPQTKG